MSQASLISTENLLTILLSLQSKVRVFCAEFQKFLIVGLNLGPCHSPKATTPFQWMMSSSWRASQQTSSLKVLIKLEAGSTLWWLFLLLSRVVLLFKTWLSMVLYSLKMAVKCQRAKRTTLIQLSSQTNLVPTHADYIFATVPLWELSLWSLHKKVLEMLYATFSCLGSTLIVLWFKTSHDGRLVLVRDSYSIRTWSTLFQTRLTRIIWTSGSSQRIKTWLSWLERRWIRTNYST